MSFSLIPNLVRVLSIVALVGLAAVQSASAMEYPIGKPHIINGIEIGALYLQPVTIEPDTNPESYFYDVSVREL